MTIRAKYISTFKNRKKTKGSTSNEVVFYLVKLGMSDFGYKSYRFYALMLEESKTAPHNEWFTYTKTFIESNVPSFQVYAKSNGMRKTCDLEIFANKYKWKEYLPDYHLLSKIEKTFLDEYKTDVLAHTNADEFKQG